MTILAENFNTSIGAASEWFFSYAEVPKLPHDLPSWAGLFLRAGAAYAFLRVLKLAYAHWRYRRSPLRTLPGPKEGASWMDGHSRLR